MLVRHMKKTFTAVLLASYVLLLPYTAFAQQNTPHASTLTGMSTTATFATLVSNTIVKTINLIIPVLLSLAILFFFIGIVKYIASAGDTKARTTGRDTFIWSLLGIFIIVTLWGILSMIHKFFFP